MIRRIATCLGILLSILAPTAHAAVWYVDKDNTSTEDGTSWATAFNTIQEGVDAAFAAGGGEVWVAEGTYSDVGGIINLGGTDTENVVIFKAGVHLYAGFSAAETERTQRNWQDHPTLIDGQNLRRCIYSTNIPAGNATLDGFTVIRGKVISGSGEAQCGAGMFNQSSSPMVANCAFTSNTAGVGGGGMRNWQSSPVVKNCTFTSNLGGAYGGGMQNYEASIAVMNCSFTGNTAARGGAIYQQKDLSTPTITNCIFTNNSYGAIAVNENCTPTIMNCTFTANYQTSGGSAVDNQGNSTPIITNCILWGHTGAGVEIGSSTGDGGTPVVDYSCVQQTSLSGTHNIFTDPLFIDAPNGNLRLQAASPCLDAGTLTGAPLEDFEENPRPKGKVDMGAFEAMRYWHVDSTNRSGTMDGAAWTTAYTTIQDAIDAAGAAGATPTEPHYVYVAQGTYTGTTEAVVRLASGIELRGGYGGLSGLSQEKYTQDVSNTTSVIDGEGIRRCVVGADGALLDGLILRNGAAVSGAGMLNDGVSPTVRGCVFENNAATTDGGGVLNLNGAQPIFEACRFVRNDAGNDGGGMANEESAVVSAVNCSFWNNTAVRGAGVANSLGATFNGMNCMLYNNSASGSGGGAILNYATASLTNSILWANAPDQVNGVVAVTYCDVMGGEPGVGNIQADPLFADAANGDFNLQIISPCIDAATATSAPSTDIDGKTRPIDIPVINHGGTYDMGVHEMPNVVYVDIDTPTVDYLQDGRSWTTAYNTIQEGVDRAFADGGGEVWVAEGSYTGSGLYIVSMHANTEVYGGFSGWELSRNQRLPETQLTTLDGENIRGCINTASGTVYDGLNLARGAGSSAMQCSSQVDVFLHDCNFTDNLNGALSVINSTAFITNIKFLRNSGSDGAGLYVSGSSLRVQDCSFQENIASNNGGAIYNTSSPSWMLLTNSVFISNTSLQWGGAICSRFGSLLRVGQCTFYGNRSSSQYGGGIADGGEIRVDNSVFSQNSASGFGGAMMTGGSAVISNTVFHGNSSGQWGGGVRVDNGQALFVNCILRDNNPYQIYGINPQQITVTSSCIQSGYTGTGNIDADPMFMDAANGNFRLKYGSPCMDTGTATGAPYTDFDDNPRPVDIPGVGTDGLGAVDMGAYEKQRYVYYVDKDNISGIEDGASWGTAYNTIQEGVDACYADGGGEVWVAQGTYTGNAGSAGGDDNVVILKTGVHLYAGFIGNEIACSQRDWQGNEVIIDGEDTRRCVFGADNATLDGFTVTSGIANIGGGMYNNSSSPIVSNCEFKASRGSWGGGMANMYASPTVTNCEFLENTSNVHGAGFYNSGSSPVIIDCRFFKNVVANSVDTYGGGMTICSSSSPTIMDCVFAGNSATYGGGLWVETSSSPTLSGCVLSHNAANKYGAAIYSQGCSPTLINCSLVANTAAHGAGGMCNSSSSPAVRNCLFVGNSGGYGGGMWSQSPSSPSVTNCTFLWNTSSFGGGMYNIVTSSAPLVKSSTFWGNIGGQLYNTDLSTPVTYSAIEDGYSGAGNISIDPKLATGLFGASTGIAYDSTTYQSVLTDTSTALYGGALTGLVLAVNTTDYYYIVNNTATTITVWGDVTKGGTVSSPQPYSVFNWHLTATSPCIDAGDPSSTVTTDLDGEARPNGARVDMGADEFYNTPPVITTNGGVGYRTGDSAVIISGTCDASSVSVRVNASTTGVTHAAGSTTWSYTGTLAEGQNILSVTTITAALIHSSAASITITYDPSKPIITGAQVRTATTLRVFFGEAMTNDAELLDPANYTFTGAGAPLTATAVSLIDAATVDLTVNEMTGGAAYTVHVAVDGPSDLTGNRMDPAANTGAFNGLGVLPRVVSAQGTQSTKVRVTFNEPMRADAALTTPANYTFTTVLGVPVTATAVAVVSSTAVDVTVNEMTGGVYYTLAVSTSGPADAAWNPVDPSAATYDFLGTGARPRLYSATALDPATVRLAYSEAMRVTAGVTDPVSYLFMATTGVPLFPSGAVRVNATTVDLTVNEMTGGAGYFVQANPSDIMDLAQNALDSFFSIAAFEGVGSYPSAPVILTNGGNGAGVNFPTTANSVTLDGVCPADTASITVNGSVSGVTYMAGATVWSYTGPLFEGANPFTVHAVDQAQNSSAPDTITVTRLATSFVALGATPSSVVLGKPVTLSGQILPNPGGSVNVTFSSVMPSGSAQPNFPEGLIASGGNFQRVFYPNASTEDRLFWNVSAGWDGNGTYMAATSAPETFEVLKAEPDLSIVASHSSALLNLGNAESFAVTAQFSVPDFPSEPSLLALYAGRTVRLSVATPEGATPYAPLEKLTDANGQAVFTAADFTAGGMLFDIPGVWKFKAEFSGDDNFHPTATDDFDTTSARLNIKEGAGYAIVCLGQLDAVREGQPEHAQTTDYIHSLLLERGFAEDDIYYMRDPRKDLHAPTKANLQAAIEVWARDKMLESPAPLYLIMVDHGSPGLFYLYRGATEDNAVSASELAGWLDLLQSSLGTSSKSAAVSSRRKPGSSLQSSYIPTILDPGFRRDDALRRGLSADALSPAKASAAEQPIVVAYGACYSGSFIPALSGPNRLIVTSCAADEISYRGVLDAETGVRDGEYFLMEFFRNVGTGLSLRDSFELSCLATYEYTNAKSSGDAEDIPQHPLLDDNGDGFGTSGLLSPLAGEDGSLASVLDLGLGSNAANGVTWFAVSPPKMISAGDPVGELTAYTAGRPPQAGDEAWVEIKTPAYESGDLADPAYAQLQRVASMVGPIPAGSLNGTTFTWTDADLEAEGEGEVEGESQSFTGFDTPGTYKVYYFLRDGDTGQVGSYLVTNVYVAKANNLAPGPVTLSYPANGSTVFTRGYFAWQESLDPNGDTVTYQLEVSEDPAFPEADTRVWSTTETYFEVEDAGALQDLTTYYWRVIPVDSYGAHPDTHTVWTIHTDNHNPAVPGAVRGMVRNAATGSPIQNAVVTSIPWNQTATSGTDGTYFLGGLQQGAYTLQVTAPNYLAAEIPEIIVTNGFVTVVNAALVSAVTNQAPVWDLLQAEAVVVGETLRFTVHADDPDDNTVEYSCDSLPNGAILDVDTGEFVWTPQPGDEGGHTVTFHVIDSGAPPLTGDMVVQITVYPAPLPASPHIEGPIWAVLGDIVELRFEDTGLQGPVIYHWYRDEVLLQGQTGSILRLDPVEYEHEGLYRGVADYGVPGASAEATYYLTVVEKLPVAGLAVLGLMVVLFVLAVWNTRKERTR